MSYRAPLSLLVSCLSVSFALSACVTDENERATPRPGPRAGTQPDSGPRPGDASTAGNGAGGDPGTGGDPVAGGDP
ncbi:MAG: hypothetical protein ACOYM9_06565, partial [Bradymonadia bacterium]